MALVEVTQEQRVAILRLNRPEKRNALNAELLTELVAALERLRADESVHCIVTVGTGNTYCSGMDLTYLKSISFDRHRSLERPEELYYVMRLIRQYPKVTIACINGYAVGGGMALMNVHDLAIASETAQIGMPEIIRGSFGRLATSSLFHSGIPLKKAFLIQLSGRYLTGAEADGAGLVSKAVKPEELMAYSLNLAHEISRHESAALTHGKIAAYMGYEMGFDPSMRFDHLMGDLMQAQTNPFSDMENYLRSQSGGPDPGYSKQR